MTAKPTVEPKMETMLSPYRVLDLTEEGFLIAGKILADMGAEVIKIEKPGGSPTRSMAPFYQDQPEVEKSLFWFAYCANKKSVTLDLEKQDGQEILKELVKKSDFLVESFPPRCLKKLGLDYPALKRVNPRLVMASITPFGQKGPYADFKGGDIIEMAMGGLMHLTGDRDRPPLRISFPQAAFHGGSQAAAAMMIAHCYRERTGRGQYIDVSVQESIIWTLMVGAWVEEMDTEVFSGERLGPHYCLRRQLHLFPCHNGYINFFIAPGSSGGPCLQRVIDWAIEDEIDVPDWMKERDWVQGLSKEDFGTPQYRRDVEGIVDVISKLFARHTTQELYQRSLAERIFLTPCHTAKEILEDADLNARGYFQKIEHPEMGTRITYPGVWAKATLTSPMIRQRAPMSGEHNQEIYQGLLGYAKQKLVFLKEAGVI